MDNLGRKDSSSIPYRIFLALRRTTVFLQFDELQEFFKVFGDFYFLHFFP